MARRAIRLGFCFVVGVVVLASGLTGPAGGSTQPADNPHGKALRLWLTQQDAQRQQKTAAFAVRCMKRAGFPGYIASISAASPAQLDGYGISTAVDTSPSVRSGFLKVLKPTPAGAATTALFGKVDTSDARPKGGTDSSFGTGCIAAALDHVVGNAGAWEIVNRDVMTEESKVDTTPAVKKANAVWAACFHHLTGAIPIKSPEAARAEISSETFTLLATAPDLGTPGEGAPASASDLAAREAALKDLQTKERTWANSDHQCAGPLTQARSRAEDVLLAKVVSKDGSVLSAVGFHG